MTGGVLLTMAFLRFFYVRMNPSSVEIRWLVAYVWIISSKINDTNLYG
jgi:hypothetical protein